MERLIPPECFRKKGNTFRGIPFFSLWPEFSKFLYHLSTTISARENGLFHLFFNPNNRFSGKWHSTFPFPLSKYRTCSTICWNILAENFIQMVSALDLLVSIVNMSNGRATRKVWVFSQEAKIPRTTAWRTQKKGTVVVGGCTTTDLPIATLHSLTGILSNLRRVQRYARVSPILKKMISIPLSGCPPLQAKDRLMMQYFTMNS